MTVVTPVAGQGEALSSVATSAPQELSATFEQKMLDYVARHQAEGLASGQHLGNPAALGGEALKSLKGYFERSNVLQESWARKAHNMSGDGKGLQPEGGMQLVSLPAGPASQRIEPPMANVSSGERVESISEKALERTIDALMQTMRYTTESTMITTATHNATRSITSLIHGQ
jgi:hypothetical protein